MAAHAKLSASGAYRWMVCPGSIKASEGYPDSASDHAREGSACHYVAEQALKLDKNADAWIGWTIEEFGVTITQELADYTQVFIDFVRTLGGTALIEQRVDFSHVVPDGFGTADAIVMVANKLFVIDLKMGRNPVVAENNSQLMLYALGIMNDYDGLFEPDEINLVIVQPKSDKIDIWTVDADDLQAFAVEAKVQAEEALSENPRRVAGEKQCHYCKAKVDCPELMATVEKTIMCHFDKIDDQPKPDTVPLEQLSTALKGKKLVLSWFEAIEKLATDRLTSGEGFPGFKMVAGRSNRAIADEDFAVKILKQSGYKPKDYMRPAQLKSITELEKVMGKKEFALTLGDVVIKPEGAPTLAPSEDGRPALPPVVTPLDFE